MSVFSSLIRTGSSINVAQLESELENELPCKVFTGTSSSLSMASASYATLHTVSLTGIEADEVGIVVSQGLFSAGTTGELIYAQHRINGSDKSNITAYKEHTGNTSGLNQGLALATYFENLSGNFDVLLRWSRAFGSGTIYSGQAQTHVLVFKKR